MTSLRSRIGAFLFEQTAPEDAAPAVAAPSETAQRLALDLGACVVGAADVVVPVAAACAGELRARAGAATALLCVWQPVVPVAEPATADPATADPAAEDPASPAGATTPVAKRLAARMNAHGLAATARGRLAWLALDVEATAAVPQFERARALADGPLVLALAGPRQPAFEPLLAELDLAVAVLPADADPALGDLALATLPTPRTLVAPPLSPGPARWAAMAGLARLRSLPQATP